RRPAKWAGSAASPVALAQPTLLRYLQVLILAWLDAAAPATAQTSAPSGPRLAGRWALTLWIDSSRARRPVAPGSASTGNLVLNPVATGARVTLRGRYSIGLTEFGLGPNAAPVLAYGFGGDSLRVILRPDVDHGHAELVGVVRLGRIEGRWNWIGDP